MAQYEEKMHTCMQFPGMSVYEHGVNVHAWFLDLYQHLKEGTPLKNKWRLPEWVYNPSIVTGLLPLETLRLYHIYHDIGKPDCRVVDAEGKQHFPDHAEVSYQVWKRVSDDEVVANLIRHDMDAHTIKGEAIDEFIQRPEAASLLLTAIAEVHSNASHLNQLDSDAFKIKMKRLDKIGKKFVAKNS